MTRKSLNDVLSNDRSVSRAAQNKGAASYYKDDYDDASVVHFKKPTYPISGVFKDNGYGGERCYESHPDMKLGGGVLIGGSCHNPKTSGGLAFAYIGFDSRPYIPNYNFETLPAPHSIYHPIQDMHAPSNAAGFKTLVGWTVDRLREGKTLHCGCIGGHGRTGTFVAAVAREILDEPDAITWARANYCKKAVESNGQAAFLEQHFGIIPQVGYKTNLQSKSTKQSPVKATTAKGPAVNTAKSSSFTSIGDRYDIFKP